MKTLKSVLGIALLSASMGSQAGLLDGAGWVTYGDGNSYSLPLNGLEVMAGPGQIDIYTKLGLQAPGAADNDNDGIMDDAYLTPSANNVEGFRTAIAPDPGGDENGGVSDGWDQPNTWDATLAALDNDLGLTANSMIFFFANNETGKEITDNLAAWARLTLTDLAGNVITLNTSEFGSVTGIFELTNDGGAYGEVAIDPGPPPVLKIGGGTVMGDVTDFDAYDPTLPEPGFSDFLRSGGNICVNSWGLIVDCDNPVPPESVSPIVQDVEHNLGGDRAAYAVVFPELDALIAKLVADGADLTQYALHVDYRLGCGAETDLDGTTFERGGNPLRCDPDFALNGGAEKVFIGTQESLTEKVPAPATLALFGLGLLGLASMYSRKRTI